MDKLTFAEKALRYHSEGRPGKIEVIPTKPYDTQQSLSLAYSPGVAIPSLAIAADPQAAYRYTGKGNLAAVISNGSAVLGLGDIGALASKPILEGKCMLFKIMADIDAFDIEINADDAATFVETVKRIAPTFGCINLEDIKAPVCFEIERRLRAELDIPIMHDDQHGTAIIIGAALINALEIVGKNKESIKIIINGAGAAAIACARFLITLGIPKTHLILCDSQGIIRTDRTDLSMEKQAFATDQPFYRLEEALVDSDVFIGVSKADVLTPAMIVSMATDPIVFALANPDPEIAYQTAINTRNDLIFATGRSDYPNQVNNVLGFPYIFRGALDVRAREINDAMKLAATYALAALAKQPVPAEVQTLYGGESLNFGRYYLIPKPFDPRLITTVSTAVAKAAIQSGVAQHIIADWEKYDQELRQRRTHSHRTKVE
ncbi:MAG: malic enzyme-like NAD(P)-binding protein [Alistipes sp.]